MFGAANVQLSRVPLSGEPHKVRFYRRPPTEPWVTVRLHSAAVRITGDLIPKLAVLEPHIERTPSGEKPRA